MTGQNLGTPPHIKRCRGGRGGGISDYDYPQVKLTNRASIKRQLLEAREGKRHFSPILLSTSSPSSSGGCQGNGGGACTGHTPSCDWLEGRGHPATDIVARAGEGQLVEKNLFKKLMTRDQSGSSRVKRLLRDLSLVLLFSTDD